MNLSKAMNKYQASCYVEENGPLDWNVPFVGNTRKELASPS